MERASWPPPPPLPRRVLNYEPAHHLPPLHPGANTNAHAENLSAAPPRAGPGASFGPLSAVNYHGHALPTTPAMSSQHYQRLLASDGANATRPYTLFFCDHMGRMALIVSMPGLHPSMYTMSSLAGPQIAGSSTLATAPGPPAARSEGHAAQDAHGIRETAQVTIQLYFHSTPSPFRMSSICALINIRLSRKALPLAAT